MWGTRVRFLFVRARPTDLRIIVIFHDRQGILIDTEWEAHHTESIVAMQMITNQKMSCISTYHQPSLELGIFIHHLCLSGDGIRSMIRQLGVL